MELKGIITPIITPMHDDESVNYDELKNQIERLIKGGVHGLFFFGTNGEAYILSREEKIKILETCARICRYRLRGHQGYDRAVKSSRGCRCGRAVHHQPLFCRHQSG